MAALAEWLRAAREARDWTQEELGERSGVAQTTISSIESGRVARTSDGNMAKLADALGRRRVEAYAAAGLVDPVDDPGEPGAHGDRLELLFAEMRRRPEVRRAVERGSAGLEGEELTEFLALTADAWYANLHMQERTRIKELERSGRVS